MDAHPHPRRFGDAAARRRTAGSMRKRRAFPPFVVDRMREGERGGQPSPVGRRSRAKKSSSKAFEHLVQQPLRETVGDVDVPDTTGNEQ